MKFSSFRCSINTGYRRGEMSKFRITKSPKAVDQYYVHLEREIAFSISEYCLDTPCDECTPLVNTIFSEVRGITYITEGLEWLVIDLESNVSINDIREDLNNVLTSFFKYRTEFYSNSRQA